MCGSLPGLLCKPVRDHAESLWVKPAPFAVVACSDAGGDERIPRFLFMLQYMVSVGRVCKRDVAAPGSRILQCAAATELMGNAALEAAMGGDVVRDAAGDTYSCRFKCRDPSGEIYYVTFSRDAVRITSYQNDAIRTTVETWADGVPALG